MECKQMTTNMINADVRNLLRDSALESAKASTAIQRAGEKAKGAYTMAVEAAVLARNADVLESAYDSVFEEIRTTGKLVGADGKAHGVNAKANKEGTGYLIPSAISSAKSYLLEAMSRAIPLTEDGEPRAFSAIRKDVMTAKEQERRQSATGDEALRIATLDMLAALTEAVRTSEGAKLAALHERVSKAASTGAKAETKGEAIAKAA